MMVLYLALMEIYFHFFGQNALQSLVRHQNGMNGLMQVWGMRRRMLGYDRGSEEEDTYI